MRVSKNNNNLRHILFIFYLLLLVNFIVYIKYNVIINEFINKYIRLF